MARPTYSRCGLHHKTLNRSIGFRICPRLPRKRRHSVLPGFFQTTGSFTGSIGCSLPVVLTGPPESGSLIILRRFIALRGAASLLPPAYCSFPQWEILAFAADVALRRRERI